MRIALAFIALCGALVSPAFAGEEPGAKEPKELPKEVQAFVEKMYQLPREGLKDLSCQLDTPIFRGNRMFKHIKVMIYFRAPEKHHLDIIGLPEETRKVFLEQLKPLAVLTRYLFCLGAIIEGVLKGSELETSMDEGLLVVKAAPKSKKLEAEFKSMTLWLDKDSRPVRLDQDSPELGKISVRTEMTEKDGKCLLSELKVKGITGVSGEIVMKIRYEKQGKFWLPVEVTLSIVKEEKEDTGKKPGEDKFLLTEYKVDQGLDDSVFPKEEKEEPKKGEDDGF